MKRIIIIFAIAVATSAVAIGCSSGDSDSSDEVVGVVTEVTGDLSNVESFVVLDDEGNSHLLTPEDGLLFYGGPLSHLREHIVTGERVRVTFKEGAYGAMTATLIVHADGDAPHDSDEDHHDDDHMDEMTTTTTG